MASQTVEVDAAGVYPAFRGTIGVPEYPVGSYDYPVGATLLQDSYNDSQNRTV